MTKTPKRRAPGRPSLPASEKKGRNLTFRIRDGMRERLSDEAALHERSLSEEIERRLQQSFLKEEAGAREKTKIEQNAEALEWMLGGNESATDLIRKIVFELQSRPRWNESGPTRKALADAVHAYIYPSEIFGGEKQQ